MLLTASPLLEKIGGRYFEDCNEAATVTRRPAGYAGVAWYALAPANAQRLWDTAVSLLRGSGLIDALVDAFGLARSGSGAVRGPGASAGLSSPG